MDKGAGGRQNKPKLSIKEKKQKKLQKLMAKQQAAANTITVPTQA
jgi:hypothetical protein